MKFGIKINKGNGKYTVTKEEVQGRVGDRIDFTNSLGQKVIQIKNCKIEVYLADGLLSRIDTMELFKQFHVWKKQNSGSMVRYCCFEDLQTKKFCVQNADFFSFPIRREYLYQADEQSFELFLESAPDERCEWYDNLTYAIAAHDLDFSSKG